MARFYARFDSGSESTLNGDYFDRRQVGANSASGALLRDGLIASRSAVSTDAYADLDAGNKDGSKGIYFPPDGPPPSGPFSTDSSTFVSWSTAYTSSVPGLVTPVTNSYGGPTGVNYSLRPTASILSTQTTLVGPTNPEDSIGVSYATYFSASSAALAVLQAIQTAGGAPSGPYSRLGLNPSRTLHSIWHDPDMTYFAWDDFTPGELSGSTPTVTGVNPQFIFTTNLGTTWLGEYVNDTNPNAPFRAYMRFENVGGPPENYCVGDLWVGDTVALFQGIDASGSTNAGDCWNGRPTSWSWAGATGELSWTVSVPVQDYLVTGYWSLFDPIITSHRTDSAEYQATINNFGIPDPGPPPGPGPDYCANYECNSLTYEADHFYCGGACPNCSGINYLEGQEEGICIA